MKKFGEIGDNKGFRLRGHIFTERRMEGGGPLSRPLRS
jgi:hypothetical protein